MGSVTERIGKIKQPYGGYIKPSEFSMEVYDDGLTLNVEENIHPTIAGLTVDYLTRFILDGNVEEAFRISLLGAEVSETAGFGGKEISQELIQNIKGNDSVSIVSACKLATFDVWIRNLLGAITAKPYSETNPDKQTVENIQIMVQRSVDFWRENGPIIASGFTFEPDGYTSVVSSGDGDYLTKDTMWDFKVSKKNPNSRHTLQLLMYWIMGQHSGQERYTGISKIGFFNPRLNRKHILDVCNISKKVIKAVERDVICYDIEEDEEQTGRSWRSISSVVAYDLKEATKKNLLVDEVIIAFWDTESAKRFYINCSKEEAFDVIMFASWEEGSQPKYQWSKTGKECFVEMRFRKNCFINQAIYRFQEGRYERIDQHDD